MTARSLSHLLDCAVSVLVVVGAGALAGCAGPRPTGGVRAVVGALSSACDQTPGGAVDGADEFRVCGEAEVRVPNVGPQLRLFFDEGAKAGSQQIEVGGVPAGEDLRYDITVRGLLGGSDTWLGRAHNITVAPGGQRDVPITMLPFNRPVCVPAVTSETLPHRVFAAALSLPDGRIFVAGGFTGVADEPTGGKALVGASDATYFLDPRTGAVTEGPRLHTGRGAHALVYLPPPRNLVAVVGGAVKLGYDDGADFPLVFLANEALASIEFIDLNANPPRVLPDEAKMDKKRVFPVATLLGQRWLLVTGGGPWPAPGKDYGEADIYDADKGAVVSGQYLVTDTVPRSGHTLTFAATETQGGAQVEVYLAWGGTQTSTFASLLVFNPSSSTLASYIDAKLEGDSPVQTYFHTVTPLGEGRFLAAGGARPAGGVLGVPDASAAYLLTYVNDPDRGRRVTVKALGSLPEPRVFHTATALGRGRVLLLGGLTGGAGAGAAGVLYFDANSLQFSAQPAPAASMAPRFGHVAVTSATDAVYLAGGVSSFDDLGAGEPMLSEFFMPGGMRFCDAPAVE